MSIQGSPGSLLQPPLPQDLLRMSLSSGQTREGEREVAMPSGRGGGRKYDSEGEGEREAATAKGRGRWTREGFGGALNTPEIRGEEMLSGFYWFVFRAPLQVS